MVDECRSQSDVRNASLTRSAPSRGWMSRGWPVRWVADGPGVASGTGESARCSRRALPGAGASLIPIIVDRGRPDARRHRYLSVVVNCRTVTAVLLVRCCRIVWWWPYVMRRRVAAVEDGCFGPGRWVGRRAGAGAGTTA
jgi:hypothetical protein